MAIDLVRIKYKPIYKTNIKYSCFIHAPKKESCENKG